MIVTWRTIASNINLVYGWFNRFIKVQLHYFVRFLLSCWCLHSLDIMKCNSCLPLLLKWCMLYKFDHHYRYKPSKVTLEQHFADHGTWNPFHHDFKRSSRRPFGNQIGETFLSQLSQRRLYPGIYIYLSELDAHIDQCTVLYRVSSLYHTNTQADMRLKMQIICAVL